MLLFCILKAMVNVSFLSSTTDGCVDFFAKFCYKTCACLIYFLPFYIVYLEISLHLWLNQKSTCNIEFLNHFSIILYWKILIPNFKPNKNILLMLTVIYQTNL